MMPLQSLVSAEYPFRPPAAGNRHIPASHSTPTHSSAKFSCALRRTVFPLALSPGPTLCGARHKSARQSKSSREKPNPSSSPYARTRKESSAALPADSSSSAPLSKTHPAPPPPAPSPQNIHKSGDSYHPDSFQSRSPAHPNVPPPCL